MPCTVYKGFGFHDQFSPLDGADDQGNNFDFNTSASAWSLADALAEKLSSLGILAVKCIT